MPKICYVKRAFRSDSLDLIDAANKIIEAYTAQGYVLTLRQLYYQFVSRDFIANSVQEYKRLGSVINDARLAGLIDWDSMEDRTRNLESLGHWEDPSSIIRTCANQFRLDKWEGQKYRIEVWIEKEALAGVFQRVCEELDVPYFSCRGYVSQSEMWGAAMRLQQYKRNHQRPIILHFGDHDPSGIDMTRDIGDRMEIFRLSVSMKRIALNMDQVRQYKPPPNPAKETDSRFASYIRKYGGQSWELDALEPQVLADLVRREVEALRNNHLWLERVEEEDEHRRKLSAIAEQWDELTNSL